MELPITGGTLVIRDKANVGIKEELQAAAADLFVVMGTKYKGDMTKLRDAKPGEITSDGELMTAIAVFGRRSLVVLATSWTRPEPLPRTVEAWLAFEEPDDAPELYKEITGLVTPIAYTLLGSSKAPVATPESITDPESPIEPFSPLSDEGQAVLTLSTSHPLG